MHVNNFVSTHHGVWELVAKVCKKSSRHDHGKNNDDKSTLARLILGALHFPPASWVFMDCDVCASNFG